ncbi:MAG: cation:proton antiporter [Planctomycetota bacterium]
MMLPTLAAGSFDNYPLLTTLAAGFAAAWVLGLLTQRMGLSPIVGYLLGGVLIGPYVLKVGDEDIAIQLSEIGVMLMMFGVGLHFKVKDLVAVRGIAIPGAVIQSLSATIFGTLFFSAFGWQWQEGMVLGMSMAVASTVVLLRVLMDREMLATSHGHAAVGWLLVEDVFTVLALVFVPMITIGGVIDEAQAATASDDGSMLAAIAIAFGKFIAMVVIVLFGGSKVIPWILAKVALLRSRELFTLTVLVLSITIAVGSAVVFGVSVALGAFLAGMVVSQSHTSHQAAADALPLRDAFAVLFFVSVGMLFDPGFIVREPLMLAAGLAIVMLVKPLAALFIVAVLGYPARTGLTVALGLANIGEFSFILGQVALLNGVIPQEGQSILVGVAMISITLSPVLFGQLDRLEATLRKVPIIWNLLDGRAERKRHQVNADSHARIEAATKPLAIVVGQGPVGRLVNNVLSDVGFHTVIIEMNLRSVDDIVKRGRTAIFGDATKREILIEAGVRQAEYIVVTLPLPEGRQSLVNLIRELNPDIKIVMRARYLNDSITEDGRTFTIYEEGETGVTIAERVMQLREMEPEKIEAFLSAVRKLWGISPESGHDESAAASRDKA